jgi:hypothetical protein
MSVQTLVMLSASPGVRLADRGWSNSAIGVGFGLASQVCNYLSGNNRRVRTCGFWLGFLGTVIASGTAFKAAINWGDLSLTGKGLKPGELYDDGGIPAIVETDERMAKIKEIQERALRSSH